MVAGGHRGWAEAGLEARHGKWLHVGTGIRNFSEVIYRDKVEAGRRQSIFKNFTSGSRLELKVHNIYIDYAQYALHVQSDHILMQNRFSHLDAK